MDSPFFPEQRHGSGSSHRLNDRGHSVVRFRVLAADVGGGGAAIPSLSHRPSKRCSARLLISRSRCLDPRASPDFFVAILWRACHHVNLPGSARFSLSDVVVVDIAFSPLLSLLTLPHRPSASPETSPLMLVSLFMVVQIRMVYACHHPVYALDPSIYTV